MESGRLRTAAERGERGEQQAAIIDKEKPLEGDLEIRVGRAIEDPL